MFAAIALLLFVLRLALPSIPVPLGLVEPLNLLATTIFIAGPIIGLFFAGSYRWQPPVAIAWFLAGVATHIGGYLLASGPLGPTASAQVALAAANTGLVFWCTGLGALLSFAIRDRNLMLPMAAFLAGFDVFLVTAPITFTTRTLATAPQTFAAISYSVPRFGTIEPLARVGPADIMFLAMFFVALHRFGMQARRTLAWILPVLIAYLAVVVFLGDVAIGPVKLSALPALLPIGATLLLVNRREFKLTRSEAYSTLGVCLLAALIAAAGVFLAGRPQMPAS